MSGRLGSVEYEQRVIRWLQHYLLDQDARIGRPGQKITIEEVRLETTEPEDTFIILFRDSKRPHCVFGFRMSAINHTDPHLMFPASDETQMAVEEPEIWANLIKVNLQEKIEAANYGLPDECDSEHITWI